LFRFPFIPAFRTFVARMKFVALASNVVLVQSGRLMSPDTTSLLQAVQGNTSTHKSKHNAILATQASVQQLAHEAVLDPSKIPSDVMLQPLLDQFDLVKLELKDEAGTAQLLVDGCRDDMNDCNSDVTHDFDGPGQLSDIAISLGLLRQSHVDLRNSEKLAAAQEMTDCGTFDNSLTCEMKSDWFAGTSTCTPSLQKVAGYAQLCEASKNSAAIAAADATATQEQFESDFCSYALKKQGVCSASDVCYNRTAHRQVAVHADVGKLDVGHKQLYLAVEKCECYIGKIKFARTSNMTATDLQECAHLKLSTNELDIEYHGVVAQAACPMDDITYQPGDDAWAQVEYASLPYNHDPIIACPATTTAAPTAAPTANWWCVARETKGTVSGPFYDIESAKAELNLQVANSGNQQLICEMDVTGARPDADGCCGQDPDSNFQTRKENGFEVYWSNRPTINTMNAMCEANNGCKSGKVWCVARYTKDTVSGPFYDIESAKAELNLQVAGSGNRQMICEMDVTGVKSDPHTVGGQNQNSIMKSDFQSSWGDWNGINRMNAMCEADCLSGAR